MRVAHIITRMIIGGAQENTLHTCLDLIRDHGDQVLLITGPSLGPEGGLLEQGRGGELEIATIDTLRRSIHPIHDMRAYREIVARLNGFAPDVVHTHSAKGGMLGRLAAWRLGVPVVVHTVHGAPFHPYQSAAARGLYRACERYAARRCHAMISVADAMTDLMVGGGVAPREFFTTIYSGMEIAPFLEARAHRESMRQRLGFADDDIVILKIARLFHLKGHDDLVTAAVDVVRDNPRVRFLWVGDGVLREALWRRIERLGLERHFVLAGLVDPVEIPRYLAAADALVHTSYREGLARALPQALLAGIPAVSYDVDGAREVVIPGETGYLVPPGDTRALAAALTSVAGDADRRHQMGRAGRQRCEPLFCHHEMTRQIRALYAKLAHP